MSDTPAVSSAQTPAQLQAATLDINQIMAILPHRYPFLLIDRVIELERRERLVAIKNVTINEPHFAGHFPGFPIMPAVLMVEAIAQAGGALLLTEIEDRERRLMVFTGIDDAKFRRQVTPGDQLRIEVKVLKWRRGTHEVVRMRGTITVDGKPACEATVTCALIDRNHAERGQQERGQGDAAPAAGESAE